MFVRDFGKTTANVNAETHLHLTRACVEHNAKFRETNAALCRGRTQRSTVPQSKSSRATLSLFSDDEGFKDIDKQTQKAVNDTGEHLDSEI